ncbi:caspase-7-like isoform X3 [Xenia sp. Carnegie-2017]|nr:caspase-7-like isoform X3 [Xenia sp. Carnegie-2017]
METRSKAKKSAIPDSKRPELKRESEAMKKKKQTTTSKTRQISRKRKRLPSGSDNVDGPPPEKMNQDEIDIVDGGAVTYNVKKGRLIIINNVEGENKDVFPDRAGSWVDAESLLKCFERIGFCEKVVHCNKTCAEMEETFNELARVDYSNVDCVVVAILTYGEKPDKLKGVDGESVSYEKLISPFFRCYNRTLIGKPKIFIIQACLGEQPELGVRETGKERRPLLSFNPANWMLPPPIQEDYSLRNKEPDSGILPPYADRLIALATVSGFWAYRDENKGSWFVEQLTASLNNEYSRHRKKTRHLHDVLTEVQGKVSNLKAGKFFVQMPELRSTLRGPIYFH